MQLIHYYLSIYFLLYFLSGYIYELLTGNSKLDLQHLYSAGTSVANFVTVIYVIALIIDDENMNKIIPTPQSNIESSNYTRRTPEDSKLDINKSIADQFDLLRIVDKKRYPCFIEHRGHKYKITMEKIK